MKARLGELQARLESHEARRSQSADAIDTAVSLPAQPTTNPDGSISPAVGAMTDKPDMLPQQPLPPQFMQQPNLYEQPVDDPENSLFPQVAHHSMLSSPPPSQPSPTAHGLLSPPTQADQTQDPRTGKNSQDFMVDCLRFQSQLLSRLNNLQQETGFPAYQNAMPNQMTTADQVNCAPAFANTEGMDFATFDGSVNMWKPEGMKMQQSSPDSTYFSNITPTGSSAGLQAGLSAAVGINGMQARKPSQNASLDERFQCIMEQVDAAGFESFDAMATAYYTQNFNDTSPLADEQRLSRNRRLPQFISEVNAAASQGWSDWERKGFQDEILRTAESMLTSEGCDARQALGAKVTQLVEAQDNGNPAGAAEAMLSMKRTIQEQLPNSWALTMALASDNRHSWQSDRSNTALATTLLLNFAGRISNDQLLRLVGSCL